MFGEEEGVLQWGNPETRCKRRSNTLRIPESVLLRVHFAAADDSSKATAGEKAVYWTPRLPRSTTIDAFGRS